MKTAYVLVELVSAGFALRGESPAAIAGGNFDERNGRIAEYQREECLDAALAKGAGGVAGDAGGWTRYVCLSLKTALKYQQDNEFWTFDTAKFFADYPNFPKNISQKKLADAGERGIFPLEKPPAAE